LVIFAPERLVDLADDVQFGREDGELGVKSRDFFALGHGQGAAGFRRCVFFARGAFGSTTTGRTATRRTAASTTGQRKGSDQKYCRCRDAPPESHAIHILPSMSHGHQRTFGVWLFPHSMLQHLYMLHTE
jgi:hypothetical protein